MEAEKKDLEENGMIAALSYVWVLCFVPLIFKRKSKLAQFHGKQGLLLFAVEILGSWIFPIPIIGWTLGFLVMVLAILGAVNALSGIFWEMPFLGRYAKKMKF
jgi:fumarate reductase subunit D